MSTYLQLCQESSRECGLGSGSAVPTTVAGQTGDLQRIVAWVKQAWDDIQNRHQDWRWMRSRFTLSATVGDDDYAYTSATDDIATGAISRFAKWLLLDESGRSNVKIYLTSAGVGTENWLGSIPYSSFRSIYKIGTQTNGYPAFVTVDPQNNLLFGPKPDGTYTVSGEYQRGALALSDNSDTPDMPSRFHQLIMYRCMEKYGAFKGAVEVFNRGRFEGNRMLRALELDQRPAMPLAGPLV